MSLKQAALLSILIYEMFHNNWQEIEEGTFVGQEKYYNNNL